MAVCAALLLPLFTVVFGDEPPKSAAPNAAWGWANAMKACFSRVPGFYIPLV